MNTLTPQEYQETLYYWAPNVNWRISKNELKIEIFKYGYFAATLFPDFYYETQRGATICSLMKRFPDKDQKKLVQLVNDFKKKQILISNVQEPKQVFYKQNLLFNNLYSEDIKLDNKKLEQFKNKQLNRSGDLEYGEKTLLNINEEIPDWLQSRRSCRSFIMDRPVSFLQFSAFMSIFKQYKEDDLTRYYYASAGGLYPIDIYIFIKENRVERLDKGLYYYNPVDNSVNLINRSACITKDSHYFTNHSIFESSAFSVYYFYNAEVTMPKYDGMGYFYGIIDSGIMVATATAIAEVNGMGVCSIGDMKFGRIKQYFNLNSNQVYLHSLEIGLK